MKYICKHLFSSVWLPQNELCADQCEPKSLNEFRSSSIIKCSILFSFQSLSFGWTAALRLLPVTELSSLMKTLSVISVTCCDHVVNFTISCELGNSIFTTTAVLYTNIIIELQYTVLIFLYVSRLPNCHCFSEMDEIT